MATAKQLQAQAAKLKASLATAQQGLQQAAQLAPQAQALGTQVAAMNPTYLQDPNYTITPETLNQYTPETTPTITTIPGTKVVAPPAPPAPVDKVPVEKTSEQRSAFALLKDQLSAWGLGALTDWAIDLYKGENAPVNYNEFYALMKEQPVYQDRFGKTNAARTAAGLAQISEAAIMELENSYKKTMVAYGLPASFYDNPDDYRQFIANDLSASEVADRVQAANAFVKVSNQEVRNQLEQYYGIDEGALTAYALDPTKAQHILTSLASKNTARIAAASMGLGADVAKTAAGMGAEELSFAKQVEGFGNVAQNLPDYQKLQGIYGATPGMNAAEALTNIAFGGTGAAAAREDISKLSKKERAQFGGSAGADKTSLGSDIQAGSL